MTAEGIRIQFERVVKSAFMDIAAYPDWTSAAADLLLHLPVVQDGITAQLTLSTLRRLHTERKWAADSDNSSCAAGCSTWPCQTAQIIGGDK